MAEEQPTPEDSKAQAPEATVLVPHGLRVGSGSASRA